MANARYWLNEFRADGLRFDAVHAIVDTGSMQHLQELSEQIQAATDGRYIHLVAENTENEAGWLKRSDDGRPQFLTELFKCSNMVKVAVRLDDGCRPRPFAEPCCCINDLRRHTDDQYPAAVPRRAITEKDNLYNHGGGPNLERISRKRCSQFHHVGARSIVKRNLNRHFKLAPRTAHVGSLRIRQHDRYARHRYSKATMASLGAS